MTKVLKQDINLLMCFFQTVYMKPGILVPYCQKHDSALLWPNPDKLDKELHKTILCQKTHNIIFKFLTVTKYD